MTTVSSARPVQIELDSLECSSTFRELIRTSEQDDRSRPAAIAILVPTMRLIKPALEPFLKSTNAQLAIMRRGQQMNVIGHRHDAVRVPFVQSIDRPADRFPSRIICERVTTGNDANRKKVNHFTFPRQAYRDAWRSSHKALWGVCIRRQPV